MAAVPKGEGQCAGGYSTSPYTVPCDERGERGNY